jgi:hypothetical protein
MSDFKLIANAHMQALVGRLGCLDAVAETINARWGACASKGTISRKCSGSLDWTVVDVVALEDALGAFPVTKLLERRRAQFAASAPQVSGLVHAAAISREAGEAVASILAAEQSDGAGERAQAIKEIDEAVAALTAARRRLAGGDG